MTDLENLQLMNFIIMARHNGVRRFKNKDFEVELDPERAPASLATNDTIKVTRENAKVSIEDWFPTDDLPK
jgi:hypothetical protein